MEGLNNIVNHPFHFAEDSVAYGWDVVPVKKILMEATGAHPGILERKKTDVFLMDFGKSSLDFIPVFSLNDSFTQLKVKSDLRYSTENVFREQKINIPNPQRDVHVIQK